MKLGQWGVRGINASYLDCPISCSNKNFIIKKVMDNEKQGYVQIPIEDIINQIQEIRTRNNKNWMGILKLAFKYAPDEAKKIMQDITECDAEINRLSKKLSEE